VIGHDMACAVCAYALNTVDDDGHITYQHPVTPDSGHDPVPVPADQLDDVYRRCHFCSLTEPVWMYRTALIEAQSMGGSSDTTQQYSTQWHACYPCAQLIEHDDSDALTRRSIAVMGWGPGSLQAQVLGAIHRAIVISREPGRNLLTTSRWSPAPLRAATLPKIRDRLGGLFRGPVGLPRPLHDPVLRGLLADGLDQAHLYWVDPEFTMLVSQVYAELPDTAVTERIVPTASGLLVWPTPADNRHLIAAASWTSHQDGWEVICYRSVGADLPDGLMETVRHEIGWLIPVHARHVSHATVVNGSDPLAALVTSWLLIAQRLAEAQPTPVAPPIRKAYARAHRPAPEVRLVRITPTRSSSPSPGTSDRTSTGRATPDHRFWVSAHQRNQAHGPGRSLRKLIDIDPFLKGPEDKPIKASTTVRILGSTHVRTADDGTPPPTED
jgi:hypothetical protein